MRAPLVRILMSIAIAVIAAFYCSAFGEGVEFNPGDAVEIVAAPDTVPMLGGIHPILADTTVFLPRIGSVHLNGISVDSLCNQLNNAYIDCLRHPSIKLRTLIRISAQGGFANPGLMYVSPEISLWELVRLAGGTLREDGLAKLKWKRGAVDMELDAGKVIARGSSLKEIGFASGDLVTVTNDPKRRRGEFLTQVAIPLVGIVLSATMTAIALNQIFQN